MSTKGSEQSKTEPTIVQTQKRRQVFELLKGTTIAIALAMVVVNYFQSKEILDIQKRNRVYEQELGVHEFWQRPNNNLGNETSELTEYLAGFELKILKSRQLKFWHTQIISTPVIELEPGKYKMHFEIWTDHSFELYSRLGEDKDKNEKNSMLAGPFLIDVNRQWKALSTPEFDFDNNIKNFLYFQLGLAPDGTTVKTRNIRFEKI